MSSNTTTPSLTTTSTPSPSLSRGSQSDAISNLENILFKKDAGDADLFTFLIQIAVNMAIAVGVLMLFSYLRPRNKAIYARRQRWFSDDSKLPPEIPDDQPTGNTSLSPAGGGDNVKAAKAKIGGLKLKWIHFIFKIPDSLILEKLGLDSLIFIRTLALFVRAFIPIAIISVCVLIPVDVIKGTKFVQANSSKITLKLASLENLEDDSLAYMWVHTAAACLFNFYVFWLIYVGYCDYIVLRQQYFTSPEYQHKISSRTLLALNLPKPLRSDEELDNLFRNKINAETSPPSCVATGRRLTPLASLIEEHEKTVRKLEKVLAKFLKDGVVGSKRPKIRVGRRKEDAIEYWTCLIQNLEAKIDRERDNAGRFKTTDFGFASFTSVAQAHQTAAVLSSPKAMAAVMKSAHAEKIAEGDAKGIKGNPPQVILAPEPRDMIWSNVSLTPQARKRRNFIGTLLFVGLCASWFIPVAAILLFAQIRMIFELTPFLRNFANTHFALMSFLQVQVAPIIMAIFWLFLPKVLQYISTFQASRTKTGTERAVFNKLFFFLVITNLFMLTVMRTGAGFYITIKAAVDSNQNVSFNDIRAQTKTMVQLFSSQMLSTSNHFTAYISLRGFFANPLELAQAVSLIVISFRRWVFASTPRQDREYTKPPPMNFGVQYSFHLFVFTVAFLFAPLTPIMPVIALIYFVISYHVYKYQSLYVNYTKIETGGRMWPMVYQRILSAQAIAQMAMGAVLYTQGAPIQAYTMIPLLLMTIAMRLYGDYQLEPRTRFVAAAYPSGAFKLPKMFSGQFKDEAKSSIITIRDFQYYDDSEALSRAGLADRFMLPKLARPLMTPEVRKEVRHLLPQVFNGRLEDSSERSKAPGKFVDSDSASIVSFGTDYQDATSNSRLSIPRNKKMNRLSVYANQHIKETLTEQYNDYQNHYDGLPSVNYSGGRMDDASSIYSVQPVDYARARQMFADPDHYRQDRMSNYDDQAMDEYRMEQQRIMEMEMEGGGRFDEVPQDRPFRSNSQRGRQQF